MEAKDREILRTLAREYAEIAPAPVQEERRELWSRHFALHRTRPPVLLTYGMHNVWCKDVFSDHQMKCEDTFYRTYERWLRMQIFHHKIGDDFICEPWVPAPAIYNTRGGIYGEAWGLEPIRTYSDTEGGSWKPDPPLKTWDDLSKLVPPPHSVDEEATQQSTDRLRDAIGDIIEIDVQRGPILTSFGGDISTTVAGLRGLQQIMIDMYESPDELHGLLSTLRDGVLANQEQAENAGDITLTCQTNQAMPYAADLERPSPNSGPRKRKDLWGFFAAQEYTLISPEFHDEFMLQYQLPIMGHYGLTHYGCCENLTKKIDMLRKAPNLRSIAVTPTADVAKCAEQIDGDYVLSLRPNPAEMVCTGWDESRIRRILAADFQACKNTVFHVRLKDIETVQGDPQRLTRWTEIARELIEVQ